MHPNPIPTTEPADNAPTQRERLAAELHRLADDIVRLDLPIGFCPSVHLGVVDSRADLERLAEYFGTALDVADSTGIPSTRRRIKLDDTFYLEVAAQSPKEESETERLRAEVQALRSQLAREGVL